MRMRAVWHQTVGAYVRISRRDIPCEDLTRQGLESVEVNMAGMTAQLDVTAVEGGTYERSEMSFQCYADIGIRLSKMVSMGEGARP